MTIGFSRFAGGVFISPWARTVTDDSNNFAKLMTISERCFSMGQPYEINTNAFKNIILIFNFLGLSCMRITHVTVKSRLYNFTIARIKREQCKSLYHRPGNEELTGQSAVSYLRVT